MFCLEAFLAQTDADVTNAIADFMDCSIVIPPTDIQDPEMLKPIINYQRLILRDRLRPADARLAYGARVKGQQDMRGPAEGPCCIAAAFSFIILALQILDITFNVSDLYQDKLKSFYQTTVA